MTARDYSMLCPGRSEEYNATRINEIKDCVNTNLDFIQDKSQDLLRLKDEINQKLDENHVLSNKYIDRVASLETRKQLLQQEKREVDFEMRKIREEKKRLVEELGETWEYMFQVRENLPYCGSPRYRA